MRMWTLIAWTVLVVVALSGCESMSQREYVPTPDGDDCYIAGRGVLVDPAIGATVQGDGLLVKNPTGCAEFFRAVKEADVDLRDYLR